MRVRWDPGPDLEDDLRALRQRDTRAAIRRAPAVHEHANPAAAE